jgi:hypothetical protein
MNEYILKVMVWLKNKDSYTKEEMEENAYAAADAYVDAAAYAHATNAYATGVGAAKWVDDYFEASDYYREDYEKEVQRRLDSKDKPMIIEMNGKRYKLVEVK